jgi:hypothetical protein
LARAWELGAGGRSRAEVQGDQCGEGDSGCDAEDGVAEAVRGGDP